MPPHNLKFDGPKKAKTCVILAHGAGESSDSAFLTFFAEELAKQRHRVARFDFPYMVQRSTTGRKRPPDREQILRETWHAVIETVGYERFVIGGKSMGGRIASLIVDETAAAGLVCLGYPFHPTGRPEKLRTEHLETLAKPALILQGERDPFGTRKEVESYSLSEQVQLHWVPDGDHSFRPGRSSDRDYDLNIKNAARATERFLFELWPL
jgi:predicted alpha/beta-hydrolase family hydrolase